MRKVDAALSGDGTHHISTVAGRGPSGLFVVGDFSGDGGPATSAQLYQPSGVALDALGDLYIVDNYNNRLRRVKAQPAPQ